MNELEQIRQAFADYRRAEGCSCCRDQEKHKAAEIRLGQLLNAEPYNDLSGYNWAKYQTQNAQP